MICLGFQENTDFSKSVYDADCLLVMNNTPKPGELWGINYGKLNENEFDIFLVISACTENHSSLSPRIALLVSTNIGIRSLNIYPPADFRYKRL